MNHSISEQLCIIWRRNTDLQKYRCSVRLGSWVIINTPAIQRAITFHRVPCQSYQNKEKQKRAPSQPVAATVGPATGC